jgi:hypothetical protein
MGLPNFVRLHRLDGRPCSMLIAYSITTGDQTSMLVGAAVVLQRVLTLTWDPSSVSKFNLAFCSFLALAVAVRLVAEYSSLLEIVFAAMIVPACFLTVYRVEKADDEAFRTHGRWQAGVGAGELMQCAHNHPLLLVAKTARGLATFEAGYALWWTDILLCTKLRNLRAELGLPWAFVLELHGWYVKPLSILSPKRFLTCEGGTF